MARPQKQGLDYFALDVNMNDEVELIEAEHGIAGFAILIKLFQKIYGEGYFYQWNEKNQLLFSSRVTVDKSKLENIVNDCIKWGIFNEKLYEKHKILTSRRIQQHYIAAVYKRVKVEIVEEYLLIDIANKNKITLIQVSDNGNLDTYARGDRGNSDTSMDSDIQSTQSKVKKSKVNKSIEYNIFLETYNNQNIIIHNDLNHNMKESINKALSKDKEEDILKAIRRYGQAFRDEGYQFCTYKMTLDRFLTQHSGYVDWLDEGQKWINYIDFKNKVEDKPNENQQSQIKTKFHLAKSRGDKYTADELEQLVLNNQKRRDEKVQYGQVTSLFDKCNIN